MNEQSPFKIDLIELRRQEIKHAILLAKSQEEKEVEIQKEKELPWYKKELFLNVLGAAISVALIAVLFVVSFIIAKG